MNAQLKEMIRCTDPNRRAKLAVQVQADIERVAKGYLHVVDMQHRLVRQLLDAGLTHIPDSDEEISLDHISDEVGAGLIIGSTRKWDSPR